MSCWLVFILNSHWFVLIKFAPLFCSITYKTPVNCHLDSQCFQFKFPSAPCGIFLFISLAVVITFILIFRHLRKIRFSFKPQFKIALDQRKTFFTCVVHVDKIASIFDNNSFGSLHGASSSNTCFLSFRKHYLSLVLMDQFIRSTNNCVNNNL